MSELTWLTVEPLDSVMVRDGREFSAGENALAVTVPPAPSTFGGVVAAAHGDRVERILGPVPHLLDTPLFPAPMDLVRVGEPSEGQTVRRLPVCARAEDETNDLDTAARLSHALAGDGDPVGGWVTAEGMAAWLCQDGLPSGADVDEDTQGRYLRRELWREERHVGLALDADTGMAVRGLFYAATHLRPVEGLGFVVGCENPGAVEVSQPVVPLGGRGRLARVRAGRHGDPFPPAPDEFPGGRLVVYLLTPALVHDTLWCPAGTTASLSAAAIPGPQPVATASPKTMSDSRRLMWTVPAGSLYFLTFDTADDASDFAARYHGKLLPGVPSSDNPVVTAGFGTCLTGRW